MREVARGFSCFVNASIGDCLTTCVARPEVRKAWRNRTSVTPIAYGSERATPIFGVEKALAEFNRSAEQLDSP